MNTTLTLKQEEELIRAQTAAIVAAGQELRQELAAIDAEADND